MSSTFVEALPLLIFVALPNVCRGRKQQKRQPSHNRRMLNRRFDICPGWIRSNPEWILDSDSSRIDNPSRSGWCGKIPDRCKMWRSFNPPAAARSGPLRQSNFLSVFS